jgi:hypothetical protein
MKQNLLTVFCNSLIITFLDFDCKTVCTYKREKEKFNEFSKKGKNLKKKIKLTFSIRDSGTDDAGTIEGIRPEPTIRLDTRPRSI